RGHCQRDYGNPAGNGLAGGQLLLVDLLVGRGLPISLRLASQGPVSASELIMRRRGLRFQARSYLERGNSSGGPARRKQRLRQADRGIRQLRLKVGSARKAPDRLVPVPRLPSHLTQLVL